MRSAAAYTPARVYRTTYKMLITVEADVQADDGDEALDQLEHMIERAADEITSGGSVRIIRVRTTPEDGDYDEL